MTAWACWVPSIDPDNPYSFEAETAKEAAEECAKAMRFRADTPTEVWVSRIYESWLGRFRSCRFARPEKYEVTLHGDAGERVEAS